MARLLWPVAMMRLAQVMQALLVHAIVVDQCAARRFGGADAFQVVERSGGADVGAEDFRIGEELLHVLEAEKNFDQARVVVVERAENRVALRASGIRSIPAAASGVPQRSTRLRRASGPTR